MNMKFAALALAGLAMTPAAAFAQSAPAPINQTGPGVTAPVSTSTDLGIAGQSGNTHAVSGGVYAAQPRTVVGTPGYESYSAVPSAGYVGGPAYGGYGAHGSATVGYGDIDYD